MVIAIIGILAAVLLPRYFGFAEQAKQAAVISEAKSIRSMADIYMANNEVWPVVSATTGFKVQTGGTTGNPDFTNSPTFSGTITPASISIPISDGAFTYTVGTHSATCDANGSVTGT